MSKSLLLPCGFIGDAMRTNSHLTGTHAIHPDTIHAILGILDEVQEFRNAIERNDFINAMEELGDALWFGALFENSTESLLELQGDNYGDWVANQHLLTSYLKSAYAYGRLKEVPLEDLINVKIKGIIETLLKKMLATVFNHESCMADSRAELLLQATEIVIKKLKTRYPEKFTVERATNRDLTGEMITLHEAVKTNEA